MQVSSLDSQLFHRSFCHTVFSESHPHVKMAGSQIDSLSTACSELPQLDLSLLEDCLSKLNEVLENDWKR